MANDKAQKPKYNELPRGLARVKHIIAIGSGKGGVGKSTVSTNLAIALKNTGAKVGLLDADIYGPSQPGMLGAKKTQPSVAGDFLKPIEKHGICFMSLGSLMAEDQPVIWRAPIATKMIMQFLSNVLWDDLDYLLVDLPPGTGDVQITLAQQASLTGAIIVTTPQQVALGVARKGLQMFENVNVPILGIIENMSGFVCPHCGKETDIFKVGGGKEMAEKLNVNFFGGIPIDPELMASGDSGVPLMLKGGDSPAVKAFNEIASRFHSFVSEIDDVASNEPKNIEVKDGNLVVEWPDGETATYEPYNLRIACPCAMCVSEETGHRLLDPKDVPLDVKIGMFENVGRYAVALQFSDGHNTGIYRYDYLKELEKKSKDSSKGSFSV